MLRSPLPLTIALAVFAAAGCHIDLNDPGTDPPVRQLYFPVGLAYDTMPRADGHIDRYLYVSNHNADLRYGGGLVQVIDLRRFNCAVGRWCETKGVCPMAADGLPVLRMEASCDPAKADADLALRPSENEEECQLDPIDPSVVDCDETPFIVGNASVRVGNFAGGIKVYPHPRIPGGRRLFVAVRGDPSITWIEADLNELESYVDPRPGVLNCFDNPQTLTSRDGYDAARNVLSQAAGCDGSHQLYTFTCDGRPGCNVEFPTLPTEPFGMQLDTGRFSDGKEYARLLVSHLQSGQVTLIDATATQSSDMIRGVSPAFFTADNQGRRGAFALAQQRRHDPASTWYMTSNLQPVIATFRVANADVIVPSINFSFGGAFALGNDVRDIAFEPGGQRAFLTENNPPSVLVIDTRVTEGRNPGQPLNQLVDIVNVCQTPSHMGVRRAVVPGAPGAPARLATDIYVACFLSNQLMVVDPDAAGVLDTILVGRGPNDVAFNFGDVDDPEAPPAPPARRGYVTHFGEMTIGEIDLEPGSPTRNRMVARIGKPLALPKR
jgi:hypothetical protein